jgi:hypothetical protein
MRALEANLTQRIAETHDQASLGEVVGLQETLAALRAKTGYAERLAAAGIIDTAKITADCERWSALNSTLRAERRTSRSERPGEPPDWFGCDEDAARSRSPWRATIAMMASEQIHRSQCFELATCRTGVPQASTAPAARRPQTRRSARSRWGRMEPVA